MFRHMTTTTSVPRSERVSFPIPIQYRRLGDSEWRTGVVVNLSDSGVLFEAAVLEPGAHVELALSPPIRVGWLAPSQPVCAAQVVRIAGPAVAVRFEECHFSL
jgi:hypothetical protein